MTFVNPWAAALEGEKVGEYKLVDFLGNGAFGLVYRAKHQDTDATVAVKILDPMRSGEPRAVEEFHNEGVLLQKLVRRSHVINWIHTDTQHVAVAGGLPTPISFHVLAEASGGLDELTGDPAVLAAMPWVERVDHWRGAVLGTHQMHLSQVAHRDLKAENCLLMVGKRDAVEVRVADLGRAKDFSRSATLAKPDYLIGRGDPSHAAPEFLHIQGGSTGKDFCLADLYGLGSLLTELATGHSMTALALGPWTDVFVAARQDFEAGISRELSSLRPQFMSAAQEAAQSAPSSIRHDLATLLTQLCDPVPENRLPKVRGRAVPVTDGLPWLLRRADIMKKRLQIENRAAHKQKKGA